MKHTIETTVLRGNVHYGIITIREDEAKAVLSRMNFSLRTQGGHRTYDIAREKLENGTDITVAHIRSSQGPSEARKAANSLIRDLEPSWIIVVGIAGTIPNEDVCLGDVVISSAIYDPRIMASNSDGARSFAMNKEQLHQKALDFIAQLPGMEAELGLWHAESSISLSRPKLSRAVLSNKHNQYIKGSPSYQKRVLETLNVHFGQKSRRKNHPVAMAVPFLSGGELVKDPSLVERWLVNARDFKAIEMELIGVHEACTSYPVDGNNVPLISIRGISDVVGLTRESEWTKYACESAAAFTIAAIKSGNFYSMSNKRSSKTLIKCERDLRDPQELLKLGSKSIIPKLVFAPKISPIDVFNELSVQTLTKKKVTIYWNVRPVPHLGLIHMAYLQQLVRFKEWGFQIRVVLYDVCTSDFYDSTQIATVIRKFREKIRQFKGLEHHSNVILVSNLLKEKSSADVISTLFSLGRPAMGREVLPINDPATSLDNLLCIAVERWNSHHILLAGAKDSNDFWTNYRAQLAESGLRSDFPSLILDFPKLSIGTTIIPEDLDTQPNENDTIQAIVEKLKRITPKEIEDISDILLLLNESSIEQPSNIRELASAIYRSFRTSPYYLKTLVSEPLSDSLT